MVGRSVGAMQDIVGQNILIDSQSKSLANVDVVERFGQEVESQEIDIQNSGMVVVFAGPGAGKIGKWNRGIVNLTGQIRLIHGGWITRWQEFELLQTGFGPIVVRVGNQHHPLSVAVAG